jgi:hypothetical protein
VTRHLVRERVLKPQMSEAQGGGSPDSAALRAARANIRQHLKYTNWLAGTRITYADLAAAGLRCAHMGYFFHGVYPAILLNNLARGRKRDIRFIAPSQGIGTAMNRVVGSLFAGEASLLPGGLVGSSIIAVASRA